MANTAYINGNFHSAAEVYEEILSRGVSSVKLYYNLANAYFKEDRIGKAILYYKRALRLAPGNDDIRHNLSVAEARTKDNIEDIPEFFFVTWMREVADLQICKLLILKIQPQINGAVPGNHLNLNIRITLKLVY